MSDPPLALGTDFFDGTKLGFFWGGGGGAEGFSANQRIQAGRGLGWMGTRSKMCTHVLIHMPVTVNHTEKNPPISTSRIMGRCSLLLPPPLAYLQEVDWEECIGYFPPSWGSCCFWRVLSWNFPCPFPRIYWGKDPCTAPIPKISKVDLVLSCSTVRKLSIVKCSHFWCRMQQVFYQR